MDRPRPTRRPTVALLAAFAALVLLLAACAELGLLETTVEGVLRDASGAPVAGAVVFAPESEAGAAAAAAASAIARSQTADCQAPSEAATASTCTDAAGRFSLRVATPLIGTLRLVFERLYWRTEATIDLGLRVPGEPIDVDAAFPGLDGEDELEAAVRWALPTLERFVLIDLPDEKAIAGLLDWTTQPSADVEPYRLTLPILQPGATTPTYVPWIAYHHDLRAFGVADCAIDPDTFADVDCEEVPGPSLTFQGMPWMEAQEMRDLFIGETEKNLADETLHQMSVISIVGDELEATYYGLELEAPHTPSSLQGLRSVLDTRLDAATVDRLLAGANVNYLLHNQVDLNLGQYDDELHLDGAAHANLDVGIAPANHFLEDGIKYLRPVMVADSTVYNAVAGERLVPNYFARVDAMANRQDLFFAWANLSSTAAPANLTSLTSFSNAFAVRTRIGGYRRLTVKGQEGFTFPTNECGALGDGTLIDEYAERSRDENRLENEYWMWWTNTDQYPGSWGCAGGFGVLHETPRDGAVSWTSFRNYTLETVGQTFMHEGGHLFDAVHPRAASGTRCTVLGILPFGVTGPSIMGGTGDRNLRANCFAVTPETASSLRNRTRVAEYLHARLE
jgi:hypothetical protein